MRSRASSLPLCFSRWRYFSGPPRAIFHAVSIDLFPARALFAGTIASAQIIALETLLGATGLLTRKALIGASVLLGASLLAACVWATRSRLLEDLRRDARSLLEGF